MALLLSLRGTVCLYQGEELGLPEASVPFERLRDPYGITFWPAIKGRDGARTPMPWSSEAAHGGFSEVEPWLPLGEEHRRRAVDLQERAPDSVLKAYRRFLSFRREHPALRTGTIRFIDAPPELLVFEREATASACLPSLTSGKRLQRSRLRRGQGSRRSKVMASRGLSAGTRSRLKGLVCSSGGSTRP